MSNSSPYQDKIFWDFSTLFSVFARILPVPCMGLTVLQDLVHYDLNQISGL